MKQDNALRFVALRGPEQVPPRPRDPNVPSQPPPPDSSVPVPIRSGDNTLVDRIRTRVEGGTSLEEARTAVVTEFLASPSYVPRDPAWRGLLELQATLAALLGEADATTERVRREIERLLSRHFGRDIDLREFARSEEFRRLRANLWNSYCANVAQPDRRPQDRAVLEFWIKLFEVIANVSADYPSVTAMEAMRPVIPLVLVQEKTPEPEPPDEPLPSARREQVLRARTTLAELKATEAELKRLYEASLTEPPPAPSTRARLPAGTLARSLDDPREPWTVQESELSPAIRDTLTRENIALGNRPLPLIIDQVQGRIAKAYLRVHGMERITEVVLSGGIFVRRRRKIRVQSA